MTIELHQQLGNQSQGCIYMPSLPPNLDMSNGVRNLNNRASVLVSSGDFSKARILYEDALTNHLQMARDQSGVSNTRIDTSNIVTRTMSNCAVNDEGEADSDFDIIYDDAIMSSNISAHDLSSKPNSKTRNHRISSFSQLKTHSYCGQGVDRPSNQWMDHQIYCMPIVMNPTEWEMTQTEMRSFVLIFNSALCNHLQGMDQLSQHQPHSDVEKSFRIAKVLYELALNALMDAHSKGMSGLPLRSFERLCCPSVFNNLSHVCKTIQGDKSYEAHYYDTLLLKSIFWLIDSACSNNEMISNQSSPAPMASTSDFVATSNDVVVAGNSSNDSSNDSSNGSSNGSSNVSNITLYSDNEAEMIDAFFENVFYLIGASNSMVPAAAA